MAIHTSTTLQILEYPDCLFSKNMWYNKHFKGSQRKLQ